jgi:E-phenylitaconyl-CoA hydratase
MSSTFDGFTYDKQDHVAWIVINRPKRGNALLPEMHEAMSRIWSDVRDDPQVRVAVITGAGDRHFCTGADVGAIADRGRVSQNRGPAGNELFWSPRQNGVWKPVLCAVNGSCLGAGLQFVADADIVFSVPGAEFVDTHVNIGLVGGVENAALAQRLPIGTVLRMTLVGRDFRLTATRAYELGLVDDLVEPSELLAVVGATAASIAANSPTAVSLSKQAIWRSRDMGYHEATEYAWSLIRLHWGHPDFSEGLAAFAEKRDPLWQDPEPPGIDRYRRNR